MVCEQNHPDMPEMCPDVSCPQVPRLLWELWFQATKDGADKRQLGTKVGGEALHKAQRRGVPRDEGLPGASLAYTMRHACPDCGPGCRASTRAGKRGG